VPYEGKDSILGNHKPTTSSSYSGDQENRAAFPTKHFPKKILPNYLGFQYPQAILLNLSLTGLIFPRTVDVQLGESTLPHSCNLKGLDIQAS